MKTSKIILGSDHAGLHVKNYVKSLLEEMGYQTEDVGTYQTKRVDYPLYVEKAVLEVLKTKTGRGVFACGTGIGASIAANKIPGIRAALVNSVGDARLSRQHNHSNLLILGGWGYNRLLVRRIVQVWLKTRALEGRHLRRVKEIARIERKYLARSPRRSP